MTAPRPLPGPALPLGPAASPPPPAAGPSPTPTTWRPIPGWPYEASSDGDIRRSTSSSGTRAGRMLKPRAYPNGYLYVCLRNRDRVRSAQVHALVAAAFHGRQAGQTVNHRDGIKTNNRATNLEITTPAGNAAHAVAYGLVQQGERHYAAKVTADDVRAIRTDATRGVPRSVLRIRYGLSKSGLHHILSGKNWRTVA
jgi:hypothetical protein